MTTIYFKNHKQNKIPQPANYGIETLLKKGLAGLLLLISLGNQLNAQPLSELIQSARDNNLTLQAINQDYLSALERGAQVNERPDPTFSAGVFALPIETRLGVQRLRLGVMQMFPPKGLLQAKTELLDQMALVEKDKIAIIQLEQEHQIKTAYLQLYELNQTTKILNRNIRLFSALEQFTLAKVESGKGSAADVMRVNLSIQKWQQRLAILGKRTTGPTITINRILNRRLDQPINLADSLTIAPLPMAFDTLNRLDYNQHPVIQQLETQRDIANKNLKVNDLSQKITFGVGLDYILMTKIDNFEFANNGRDVLMPKASVTIPLYKKKYSAKSREESLKIAAVETRKEDARQLFRAEIEKAIAEYEEAVLTIDLYQQQIRTIQSVVSVLETKYSTEGQGFDELLRMQLELVNYEILILKEIVRTHLAKATFEKFLVF